MNSYTIPFGQLDNTKVSQVGCKNASVGELFRKLKRKGIRLPDGFATTADAYKDFLSTNQLEAPVQNLPINYLYL